MLEEKLHLSVIYRNDRQKLRNPFPASKTHFIFQLKTRTFVRPNVRRNERTNAHTHTLVTVMPLSWCLACGGDLGFGSARETVRPAGLLHTHTFLFHQDKHETCKRSLTHRSGSRGVLTHSHHPHTPPPCLHTIYTLPSTSVNRNLSIQLRSVFELVVLWVERSTNVQSKDNIVPFNKQYITLTLTHTIPL